MTDLRKPKTQVAPVTLLQDLPTSNDDFGPHQGLASAIAEVIRSENGGKAIALEGGWGSGKSSVVAMLRQELEGDDPKKSDARVFIFDAWSHEGDPLRRVFLESLTAFCETGFSSSVSDEWRSRLRTEVSGKKRQTDQSTVPILRSPLPLLSLVLLTLFPIAVAMLSGLVRKDFADAAVVWSTIAAGVIAGLVPLLLFALFVYCAWPFWPFTRFKIFDSRKGKPAKLERAGQLISLYAKKTDENTRTTVHETLGPTSIEFQSYFSDLLRQFLENKDCKLVIVLDNLDRVPTATAKTLWTTLRVFAECCEDQRNSTWANRVWFIVPYDPDAARRLWDDGEESALVSHADSDSPGAPSKSTDGKSDARLIAPVAPRLSAAFLDKTFQVRFDVPPLLLADWKSFLENQLKNALGPVASTKEAVHNVYLLSRHMSQKKRRPPTPRHLKLYVNDICALYRRFQGAFPVDHMAVYAILRRQGHDVRLWLLGHQADRGLYETLLRGSSFVDSLCAMAHGTTDKDRARDLLLRTPIEASLAEGDHEELVKLSSAHGFWQVLEIICDDPASKFGVDESRVINALKAIEKGNLLDGPGAERIALKRFLGELVTNAEWEPLDEINGNGAAVAFRLGLDGTALASIMKRLASIRQADGVEQLNVEGWLDGVRAIALAVVEQSRLEEFKGSVTIPATEKTSRVLAEVAKLDEDECRNVAALLRFQGEIADLVLPLLPQGNVAWSAESFLALCATLLIPNNKINTKEVINPMFGRLQADAELNHDEIEYLVAIIGLLEAINEKALEKPLRAFVESGHCFRRIKNCEQVADSSTVSHLLQWSIRWHNFASAPTSPTNASEGYQLAKKIGAAPKDYPIVTQGIANSCRPGDASYLLNYLLAEVGNLYALVVQVLVQLREQGRLQHVLRASGVIEQVAALRTACNADDLPNCDDLCQELLGTKEFVDSLRQVEIKEGKVEGVTLLVQAGALSKCGVFSQHVSGFLGNRTAEQWNASLVDSDSVSDLLIAVRDQVVSFRVSGTLAEAFEQVLSKVLEGILELKEVPDNWHLCRDAIPPNEQRTIARRVIERADSPENKLAEAIKLAPELLRDAAIDHSEESFVRNAFCPLLHIPDAEILEWVASVSVGQPQFWSKTPEHDVETFSQKVNDVYQSADEECRSKIRQIADALAILLQSDQGEEGESQDSGSQT